ncbi:MAG: PD40 domain-containing protein [Paludibacteraceae bacterium]|nr:PD40 domain-containing protein [Paludibacteraceae bacterium]
MRNKISILLCLVLLLTGCSTAARLKKADRKYENGEYFAACEMYRKSNSKISTSKQRKLKAVVNFRMAECYYNMNNHTKAVRSYTSAIRYRHNDSIAYLHLAKSQLATGKLADARKNFELYLESYPDCVEAQEGLKSVENAKALAEEFTRYQVSEAKEFNSRKNSDFCPMFMGTDAESIVFTSNRTKSKNKKINNPITGVPNNDIYTARKNNSGKWEEVEVIEGAVNSDEDEGVVSFSADGKTMYLTRCLGNMPAGQIYQSSRSGGEWTEPTLIQLFADTTVTVGHPAISPDGSKLYFVSDADGGQGGKDIWVAVNEGGQWTVLENLGAAINTSGNEMFPYVRQDGALFFSSDGHEGFGGLDIYKAEQDSAGVWHVENMYSPINSAGDDFGITFSADNSMGYFSSSRGQRKPIDKIYRFELPELVYAIEGTAYDDKGEALGETTIRLVGDNGDNVKMRTKKDGTYRVNLSLNTKYVMLASHRGYLNASHQFDTHGLVDSKLFENNFMLTSLSRPVKMDNIFYEFGKWTLTADSEAGLQGLVKILTDNPNIAIELSAHTDMVGNEQNNRELSQKRAQSVVDYLIKAGIDKGRLTPVGYGESKPVVVSEELAEQYKLFLKKGDVLSPEFIEGLTAEQQEICNQINRRTEFKVTKTTYNLY